MAIKVGGGFNCIKHQISAMRAGGGGAILNTASIAANVAIPGMTPYCPTKRAVLGLTRSAA
jgi:NAD(P)-dependent dehydrogenase (short-subunit alcohol dehydrogenase family)